MYAAQWSKTKKYYDAGKKKQGAGGMFQIIIDPSKCKGCAECVTVCDDDALKMIAKTDEVMTQVAQEPSLLQEHRPAQRQVHQRQPAHRHDAQGADAPLRRRGRLLRRLRRGHGPADDAAPPPARSTATSGASSPPPAATRSTPRPIRTTPTWCRGPTRCSRTPRPTPSACRMRWDQMGWQDKPIWCIGGDGAMFDIGFQALSRLAGQRHEHQGVRARHAGLLQHRRPGLDGELHRPEHQDERARQGVAGKQERRKEIAQIAMMHPRTYVAQTTCAHVNHFYKSVLGRVGVRRPGDRGLLHDLPAGARRRPTTWPASRPAWRWTPGPSRS